MICTSAGLAACEDDPILAPQSGKQTNGSYGNIAVAPPIDTTAGVVASQARTATIPPNPTVF